MLLRGWTCGVVVGLAMGVGAVAQEAKTKSEGAPPPGVQAFGKLVEGLEASEGCLGVEMARTRGGKSVIFAWFEDKAAALKWYRGATHRQVMGMMGTKPRPDALANVPDDGPIMIIASVTMGQKPNPEAGGMPIEQISIEMYRPLPGGAAIGGTFAPEKLKVPNLKRSDGPQAETKP